MPFFFCRLDKLDSSFSRSRSSSMSSLDNITTESIQCLTFGDSYTKKSGTYLMSFSSTFQCPPPPHHRIATPRSPARHSSGSRPKRSSAIAIHIYCYYFVDSMFNFRIFSLRSHFRSV